MERNILLGTWELEVRTSMPTKRYTTNEHTHTHRGFAEHGTFQQDFLAAQTQPEHCSVDAYDPECFDSHRGRYTELQTGKETLSHVTSHKKITYTSNIYRSCRIAISRLSCQAT